MQFKNLLNSLDPFEHDEDDSDDKDNLPPAHVQDHTTDVKVLMYIVMFIIITNETKSIINQVASDCYPQLHIWCTVIHQKMSQHCFIAVDICLVPAYVHVCILGILLV